MRPPARAAALTGRDIGRTLRAWIPVLEDWEKTAWIASATQLFCLIGFGLGLPFLPMYVQALGVTERAQVAVWSGVISGSAALTMAVLAPVWGVLADRYGPDGDLRAFGDAQGLDVHRQGRQSGRAH